MKKINGRVNSKNFSCSMDNNLEESLIYALGGGTQIIKKFFCMVLGFKDEWELENCVGDMLLEKVRIGKRGKLSRELSLVMSDYVIEFFNNELKKKDEHDEKARKQMKDWIENAKRIKKELKGGKK